MRELSLNPLACDVPAHGRSPLSTLCRLSRKLRTKSDKKTLECGMGNAECGMGKEKWQMTNGRWRMANGECGDEEGQERFLCARKWVAPSAPCEEVEVGESRRQER